MDRVKEFMPIARPTRHAEESMKALVQRLLEERGKPMETVSTAEVRPVIETTEATDETGEEPDEEENDTSPYISLIASLPPKERADVILGRAKLMVQRHEVSENSRIRLQALAMLPGLNDPALRQSILDRIFQPATAISVPDPAPVSVGTKRPLSAITAAPGPIAAVDSTEETRTVASEERPAKLRVNSIDA